MSVPRLLRCALALGLALAVPAAAAQVLRGVVVLSGEARVAAGDVLVGSAVVLGGRLTLAAGARLEGSVWVLGGRAALDGDVHGDVTVIAGEAVLGAAAAVDGTLRSVGGRTALAPGARVPRRQETLADALDASASRGGARDAAVRALLAALAAVLAGRFLSRPAGRIGRVALRYPAVSASIGGLAGLVGLVLVAVMAFTLVLVPLAVALAAGLAAAVAWGWVAVAVTAAERAPRAAAFRPWARLPASVRAALAGAALALGAWGVERLPWVGGPLLLALAAWSLGAVLWARLGWHAPAPPAHEAPEQLLRADDAWPHDTYPHDT